MKTSGQLSVVSGQKGMRGAGETPARLRAGRPHHSGRPSYKARRGTAFITALWIIIALTGLVLVLSQSMRVEAIASANRLSEVQAAAIERGVEQTLMSLVDQELTTPGTLPEISLEARQMGNGYFWVLQPDADDEQTRTFGLTDEGGKLDLNTASQGMLVMLPNMTTEVADCIIDWRDADSTPQTSGAEDSYYASLNPAYHCKNAPLESVDELLLVKGMTTDILYNYDRNHDGMVDTRELQNAGTAGSFNSGNGSGRGIAPYVTVYGTLANTTTTAVTSSSTTTLTTSAPTGPIDVNGGNLTALRDLITQNFGASRTDTIMGLVGTSRPFRNVFDFAVKVNLTAAELGKIMPRLTANPVPNVSGAPPARATKINVNSAPKQVLMCLPGLTEADASAIRAHLQTNTTATPADISWLMTVLSKEKAVAIGSYVTGASSVYSGDILAVSGDGRSFKRVRVVIDGSSGTSKIIWRKDMTNLGWPLDADTLAGLRLGQGLNGIGGTNRMNNTALGGKGSNPS